MHKMSIFKRFNNAIKKENKADIPATSTTGITGNIPIFNLIQNGNVMQNASVIRGISAIANAISILELNEFKLLNGDKIPVDSNIEYLLNCSPNDYITASNFKKKLIENVFNYGNGLVKIERDLNNNITALYLCDSTKFQCKYNQITNIPTYYYIGKQIDITDYLLIYFYADSTTNGYSGIPLKQYANSVLKKVNTVENFESNYFNGNAITGILSPTTPDRPLPQQQAEKAKKDFLNASSNNGIVVLDGQMKYDRVSTNAKDNALLELQEFNVNQVARVLNIPVSYLFDGSAITEQEQTIFITQTIAPIASILLNEMKRKFFFKSEYKTRYLEFNYESLIKSDRTTIASYYSQLFRLGVISPNEICRKLNLQTSTIEGTDNRYIEQNIQPIDINLNAVKAGLISNE